MERTECASVITLHTSPILYYTCTISLKGRDNVRCTGLLHSYFIDVTDGDYLFKHTNNLVFFAIDLIDLSVQNT
jgi:hypothetical protein